MIDWVDDLGKDWGRYLRRNPTGDMKFDSGYPKNSVMGRIREEGTVGAAIRTHMQILPIRDMPKDVLEFHRAWQVLDSKPKRISYVHYGVVSNVDAKCEFMGLNKSTYYSRLDRAHRALWETIELQSGVQLVQPVPN